MKIASFTYAGSTSYGVVEGDRVYDIGRALGESCPSVRHAIAAGVFASIPWAEAPVVSLAEVTLLPPVTDPDKIVCIGLNYRAHAAEGGFKLPEHPSTFVRLTNTLVGSGTPMILPKASSDFDYEAELAVIIGTSCRNVSPDEALDHVFGYACFNDGSLRDWQFNHSLTTGKNFPATGGFGPWITTADEIADPQRLTIVARLNGREVQRRGTDDMIFDVRSIISYVSTWTQLVPGDVIATGTPEGVGFARKPPLWMRAGDTIEIEISSLGSLRNPIVGEA